MSTIVKSHHVEITDALKEYADAKADKLRQFFDGIISIEINLIIEATSAESDRNVSTAIVKTNAGTITAREHSDNMYACLDLLYDKCRRQLKKTKEKQKHHKGHMPADGHGYTVSQQKAEPGQSTDEKQRYIPKPMGPEDAAEILQEEKLNFLVFRDLKENICVIYKTEDGGHDIIETN